MKRVRIDLVAPPFAGHLHPLLGLARALAGDHDVRVLSSAAAQPRIAAAGLPGVAILPGADDALRTIVDPPYAVGSNPLRLHRQFHAALALFARAHTELGARFAHDRPELVIADFTLPVAGSAAAAAGVPWWTSMPSPCVLETGDGPPAYFGGLRPTTSPAGRALHAAGRLLVRGFKRTVFAWYRRRIAALGISQLYRADGSEAAYSPTCVLALGVPELELARAWPAAVRFVGAPLYTPPSDGPPPPFVAGRRHVLVTLGTHLRWHKDTFAREVQRAAAALPDVELHFTDGDAARGTTQRAGNFTRLPFVDYDRFLGRYAAVVHHGGAGVMYHTLANGLPAVVYPRDYDQFDHAARLEHAGLAHWLRRARGLAPAVARVLADERMAAACARFARLLQQRCAGDAVRALVAEQLG